MNKIFTLSKILLFGENEILNLVDKDTLSKIKSIDAKPLFKAYTIAHEGITKPKVVGAGYKKFQWGRNAVESAFNALKVGIQAIAGHSSESGNEEKHPKASVVGFGKQLFNNILHTIAVLHFPDKTDSDYDTISMEASIAHDDNPEISIVDSIKEITKLALGKAGIDSPAFTDAKVIASIQCFEDTTTNTNSSNKKSEDNKNMTLEEIVEALKKLSFTGLKEVVGNVVEAKRIFPSQFFEPEQLIGKVSVKNGIIEIEGGDKKVVEYIQKPLSELHLHTSKLIAESEDKVKKISKENLKLSGATKLDDVVKAKKLTLSDKQDKFLKKFINEFEPGEDLEKSLGEFVDKKLEEFKIVDSIYNPKVEKDLNNPKLKDEANDKDASDENKDYM